MSPGVSWPAGLVAGRVVALHVAGAAGDRVQDRSWVDLRAGVGVVGDRYATGTGHWSDPRWPDRQVTLVEARVAADLGLRAGLLRRNIVTEHVRLTELIGVLFRVGVAELFGVRPCDPCLYLERLLDRPGLAQQLRGRGGLRADVVAGGRITVGDEIVRLGPAFSTIEQPDRWAGRRRRR